jgi:hypothetical protein
VCFAPYLVLLLRQRQYSPLHGSLEASRSWYYCLPQQQSRLYEYIVHKSSGHIRFRITWVKLYNNNNNNNNNTILIRALSPQLWRLKARWNVIVYFCILLQVDRLGNRHSEPPAVPRYSLHDQQQAGHRFHAGTLQWMCMLFADLEMTNCSKYRIRMYSAFPVSVLTRMLHQCECMTALTPPTPPHPFWKKKTTKF